MYLFIIFKVIVWYGAVVGDVTALYTNYCNASEFCFTVCSYILSSAEHMQKV